MKKKSCIILLIMGWALAAYALENRVRVTGAGFAPGGDMSAARDMAILDAQIRAVESLAGTRVDAESIIHETLLMDDTVRVRAAGQVRDYEVVKEYFDSSLELYYVTIDAVVDPQSLDRDFAGAAGQKRILFLRMKGQDRDQYLTRELGRLFDRDGFTLSQVFAQTDAFDLLNTPKADSLLKIHEKDILIAYAIEITETSCRTSNFCVARGKGNIRLFAPLSSSGQQGFNVQSRTSGEKGFGNTQKLAQDQVVTKVSDKLKYGLMSQLEKQLDRIMKIQVMDIPDYETFKSFKQRLKAFRWITRVEEDSVGYHPRKSIFIVSFRQTPALLGSMLESLNRYEYLGRQTNIYTLKFKRGENK